MKKLNKKGFSLVELLAAIAILAILMTVATQVFNSYKKKTRQQAYDTMAKSATAAATNYLLENAKAKYITFETLKERQYVDTLQDPRYKDKECTGIVINKVMPGETQKQLDILFQKVKLCCKNYKYQYDYTGDEVTVTEIDSCEYVDGDEIAGVYKLIYKTQGGTVCDPGVVIKQQKEEWGPLCVTTKENNVFKGWNTKKNGSGSTITEHTIVGDKDLNAYAIWNPIYTLTYDEDGGTVCNPKTIEKENGEKWGTLCSTTKEGYAFKGWNTKKDGSGSTITKNTIAEKNLTVYAKWNPYYTLTYDSNGGTTCDPNTITKENGEEWGKLCTPKKEGYIFAGWKNGTTTVTSTSKASANITVTAQWKANSYTLKYNDNGGSGCSSKTITKKYNTEWGTLCTPTKTGYTFAGWKNGTTTVTSTSKATANITVTAQWTIKTYTLTYNSNGGTTCSPTSISKTYNTAWGTLCTPTRIGFTFAGWKNGTTTVTSTSKATANITVTAQWTQLHTLPIFTYTGSYQLVTDNDTVIASGKNNKVTIPSSYATYTGNWKIRFLTSGTLTFHELRSAANGIDVFVVGGGGNGGNAWGSQAGRHGYASGGAGGGGGYNKLSKGKSVSLKSYSITIGAARKSSSGFGVTASAGGNGASQTQFDTAVKGGASNSGKGGTGKYNSEKSGNGGSGVCEFNDCTFSSKRYGGGGGGGHGENGYITEKQGWQVGVGIVGSGGAGGGGEGNNTRRDSNSQYNGQANTGGGGGGSSWIWTKYRACVSDSGCHCWSVNGCIGVKGYSNTAGTGGSGIVIIRNKR